MAIKPKQILDTAVDLGKAAVSAAERRLRSDATETDRAPSTPGTPAAKTVPKTRSRAKPSGSPSTVGAAKPGKPRAHKSATAAKEGATGSGGNGKAKRAPKAKTAATPKAAVEKGKAKPRAPKSATPRKKPASARRKASEAAASSAKEVRDAASGKSD